MSYKEYQAGLVKTRAYGKKKLKLRKAKVRILKRKRVSPTKVRVPIKPKTPPPIKIRIPIKPRTPPPVKVRVPVKASSYTTPDYNPNQTKFTDAEIANYRSWSSSKSAKHAKTITRATDWQIIHSMLFASSYPDYPTLELKNGKVVNTRYWIEAVTGTYTPIDQYRATQLFINDREEWNKKYWNPYN